MSTLIYDTLIVPGASVPTHDGAIGLDGIATLANLAAITAITTPYKRAFMQRTALDTGITYELQADLATWISMQGGGDSRTAWSVNSATGVNTAFGDAGAPLLTLKELVRRWTHGGRGRQKTSTNTCTVTIDGNPGLTDPFNPQLLLAGDGKLVVKGTPVVARSGTIATFTAINEAAGTEDIAQITDGGIASWTGDKNKRIKITTAGARFGATAWIAGAYSAGVGAVSQFTKATQFSETLVTPIAGDTYDIETLPQIVMGGFDAVGDDNSTSFTFCSVIFQDLTIGDNTTFVPVAPRTGSNVIVSYLGCKFLTPLNQQGGELYSFGCNFVNGFNIKNTQGRIFSCLGNGASAFAYHIIQDGAQTTIGHASIFWAGGGILIYGNGAVVNHGLQVHNTATSLLNPSGDGICLGKSSSTYDRMVGGGFMVVAPEAGVAGASKLLGRSNAGVGIRMGATSRLSVESTSVLGITGAGGDFRAGNSALSLVNVDPTTNATAAGIDQTWANFAAARAAGFGGVVINPSTQTVIVTQ